MKNIKIILATVIIFSVFFTGCSDVVETGTGVKKDKNAVIAESLEKANKLLSSYDYDKAYELVNSLDMKKEEKELKLTEITTLKNSLVKFDGEVPHVFFHSLIVYPELAFDGDYKAAGYDLWMTTVYEFKLMLERLYERGYVLFDIREMMTKDASGKIIKKDIFMPPGKKPLVLSIDDVCYYDYMKGDGFASKLVLDENGEVANVVTTPQGNQEITKDGDVMPIVDEFIKKHPDFSYKGAKGILAVTGYEGILGYRITDVTGDEYNKMMAELAPVVNKLKETGWLFSSHSYTHNDYFKNYTITMDQMKYDSGKWRDLIKPATGETNIYISPFGVKFKNDDPRYRHLIENYGFEIYCPVGGSAPTTYNSDNMVQGRYALDGLTLKTNKAVLRKLFFEPDELIDPKRPK